MVIKIEWNINKMRRLQTSSVLKSVTWEVETFVNFRLRKSHMRDQIVIITTNRNETYNFQTNKVLGKSCGLVQLTKHFAALAPKFYLFCERSFLPPKRLRSSFLSVPGCHGPTSFRANGNGLSLQLISWASLTW